MMMSCPVWVLALAVVGMATGTGAQCWEQPRCQDLSSETNILKCIQLCRSDLTAESPVLPGDSHLQPPSPLDAEAAPPPPRALSPSSSSSSSELPAGGLLLAPQQAKRSYSMEHFRWGKPVGRKRRPVKVYTNSVENESAEDFPSEMRRANEVVEEEEEEGEQGQGGADLLGSSREEEKKDGYKMNHFRWSGPPAGKRYGGFMKSWEHENSQKPLVTLFKNVIHKNAQQKRGE